MVVSSSDVATAMMVPIVQGPREGATISSCKLRSSKVAELSSSIDPGLYSLDGTSLMFNHAGRCTTHEASAQPTVGSLRALSSYQLK